MTKTAGPAWGACRCAGDAGAGLGAADADATGTAMAASATAATAAGARRLSAFTRFPFHGDRPDWDAAAALVQSLGGAERYTLLFCSRAFLLAAARRSGGRGSPVKVSPQPPPFTA